MEPAPSHGGQGTKYDRKKKEKERVCARRERERYRLCVCVCACQKEGVDREARVGVGANLKDIKPRRE